MHKICETYHQKCFDNKSNINLTILQIRPTPIDVGLPSTATLLFNRPMGALLPQMNREPININAFDIHYEVLKACQDTYPKGNDSHELAFFSHRVYSCCETQMVDHGCME